MTRERYWLHIWGVWAIAIAQPLLQLLAASPEFFVAHRAGATEILLVLATLLILCPATLALLAWTAGLAGTRPRRVVVAVIVGSLVAVFAVQMAKQAGIEKAAIALPAAAVIGIAAALAYARAPTVRLFATVLGLLGIVVPVMFLANQGIRRLIWPPEEARVAEAQPRTGPVTTPVVMVVLDELPLTSLLDRAGRIDPVLYPNFASLAREGVWFKNATTVSDYTRWALPSMISGRWPRAEAAPNAADHPDTLFTLLGATHRMEVVEAVTQLCPERLCGPPTEPLHARLRMIADDLRIVYGHILLTEDLKGDLPALTGDWANFGAAREANRRRRSALREQRREQRRGAVNDQRTRTRIVRRFIADISAADPQPTLYFLHTMLPHTPHELLPDGRVNATRSSARVLELPRALPGKYRDAWTDDQWVVALSYQRHLLQARFVDKMIGDLVARLRNEGLYDRSLLVVVADHGIVFRSGFPRRDYTAETGAEIVRVPLLMKLPARAPDVPGTAADVGEQRVSYRNVETIDLVPTIADIVGVAVPWQTDGVSVLGHGAGRQQKKIFYDSARQSTSVWADQPPLEGALARKFALFDGSENEYRLPKPPRFAELVGRRLEDLAIVGGGGAAEIEFLSEFREVPPGGESVPFDVSGRLGGVTGRGRPTYLAVAVNGVVRAVTHTWMREPEGWLATPPLDAWRPQGNELRVFVVEPSQGGAVLRECSLREAS